jgi:hypothetical protein
METGTRLPRICAHASNAKSQAEGALKLQWISSESV